MLNLSIPKTWDELLAVAQKVKDSGTGIIPMISTLKNTWTSQMIVLADFYNVANTDSSFVEKYSNNEANYSNNPAAARSFEKLADLAQKGLINSDQFSTSYDDGMKMIAEGKGAMWPMLTQVVPVIAANYPDKVSNLGIFALPGDNPSNTGLTVWMPNSFYVTKAAKNIDTIMKFLDYYTSNKALSIFMSAQVLGGALLEKDAPTPDNMLPIVKDIMAYQATGNTEPALEFQSTIKGSDLQQICASVLNGDLSAVQGATEADKDIRKQAIQLGIPAWTNK
jgi:raffinose/stachyose/melibiose transport system substrate-binding protein